MHRRTDVPHGIIHREATGHDATGRVDVEMDRPFGVLGLEKQQLGADEGRDVIVHFAVQEDDPFSQQTGIDVERPLPSAGLFYDHRDELHRFAHRRTPILLKLLTGLVRQAARMTGKPLLLAAAFDVLRSCASSSSWMIRRLVPPVAFGASRKVTVLSRKGGASSRSL